MQGGHFDLPDRLFHSIKESWLSASEHTMADVKELIPEFFYLPEFLVNENKFDLGRKQNGECLGDVLLPPWAKNDAREFIRVHRKVNLAFLMLTFFSPFNIIVINYFILVLHEIIICLGVIWLVKL